MIVVRTVFFVGRLCDIEIEHREANAGDAGRTFLPDVQITGARKLCTSNQRADLLEGKAAPGEMQRNTLRISARDGRHVIADDKTRSKCSLEVGLWDLISTEMQRYGASMKGAIVKQRCSGIRGRDHKPAER